MTQGYLLRCAENEGGRAILCMTTHPANLATVYHFARSAAHYARLLLEGGAEYELRADEDIDAPVALWRGPRKPTQCQLDAVAAEACSRGWNGTSLDLYVNGEWYEWVYPSEGALS